MLGRIAALFISLCALLISASAQISVANFANGRGFVSPGAVAVITGSEFATDSYYTNQPGALPTNLGGVQVTFGKRLAGLRIVEPDRIVCVLPEDAPLGWQYVEALMPDRIYRGWSLIAQAAPGIVIEDGHPQGLWNLDTFVGVLGYSTPKAGATLGFTATGFRNARNVTACIQTENEYLELPVRVSAFSVPMAGLETAYVSLPPRLRGGIVIVFDADGIYSNEVFLTIR